MSVTSAIHMCFDILHWHLLRSHKVQVVDKATEVIHGLDQQSYFVCSGYLPTEKVEQLRQRIEAARTQLEQSGEASNKLHDYNMVHSKVRWTGVDKTVPEAAAYANDPFILRVAEIFHGEPTRNQKCTYDVKRFNKHFVEGDLDQIELGDHLWHVDRPYGVLKTMLFLRDVTENDGPFEIIPGSHRPLNNGFAGFMRWLSIAVKFYIFNRGPGPYAQPGNERNTFRAEKAVRLTGKAGDLVFVNTGAWHHGPELAPNGHRQVLWNYLYSQHKLSRNPFLKRLLGKRP